MAKQATYGARKLALKHRLYDATLMLTDSKLAAANAQNAHWNYHYVPGGKNQKGQSVWFCWDKKKDEHGRWWTWREVHTKTAIARYQFSSFKKRKLAMAMAGRRREAFVAKQMGEDDAC